MLSAESGHFTLLAYFCANQKEPCCWVFIGVSLRGMIDEIFGCVIDSISSTHSPSLEFPTVSSQARSFWWPAFTVLKPSVVSPRHGFINITKTPSIQEIPVAFKALCQEPGTKPREYSLLYHRVHASKFCYWNWLRELNLFRFLYCY